MGAYMKKFGDLVTEQRLSLGITMREFCIKNNINSAILSKVERNIQLPKEEEMKSFIESLKIFEGSVEHSELMKAYYDFSYEENEFSYKDLPVFFTSNADPENIIAFFKESDKPEDRNLFNVLGE